ncbi:MAG: AraC family transcriptional regulator [Clostridium sp.]|nr:AraC family transcriptional regulator [Clostridium sp.]
MVNTDILKDKSEDVHYTMGNLPVYMSTAALSEYPNMRALCHWHEDIELIRMLKGSMNYYVNGTRILLNENDCLMVNSRQLHYGYSYYSTDCRFTCTLFHPRLLGINDDLFKRYVLPVMEHPSLEYLHFEYKDDGAEVAEFLDQLVRLREEAAAGYEMEMLSILYRLWNRIVKRVGMIPAVIGERVASDISAQKSMVTYIYGNYREKLTLSDIAAAGNVCRSKCCEIFKHYLLQTPIEFLNSFRLKLSSERLINSEDSITEIALSCGFNHLSYYSELFFRSYGCTPSEYRKRHRDSRWNGRSAQCAGDIM